MINKEMTTILVKNLVLLPRLWVLKGPVSKGRSLPTPSLEPVQPTNTEGPTIRGSTPLGEHMPCLKLYQLPTNLCCHRHSPHIPIVTAISLPLPRLSEQVNPNQLLLLTPLEWVRNRHQSVAHMQSCGQSQS